MAKKQDNGIPQAASNGATPPRQFALQRVYIKDLSFESPASPKVFQQEWKPKMQVDLRTGSNIISDDNYEVVLTVTVTASLEDEAVFVAEVQQGGLFHIQGMDDEELRSVLAIVCPNTLFPYARETIDSVVIKGTFPSVMLAQVNFEALFTQAMEQAKKQAEAAEAGTASS